MVDNRWFTLAAFLKRHGDRVGITYIQKNVTLDHNKDIGINWMRHYVINIYLQFELLAVSRYDRSRQK